MKLFFKIKLFIVIVLLMFSCQKEHTNPYDEIEQPDPTTEIPDALEPTSIAGLHANIFKPTCANSGCHDGTFEPDFRTIESSYNTLVYHSIIKNDLQGTYEFRVIPSNVDQSQLMARLTYDIDGNSGVMPLVVDTDSDWTSNKETYIQNVRDWISGGAKDIFGNTPSQANGLPYMIGVAANGGNWMSREGGTQGTLWVPASVTSLDIFIALTDDETAPTALTNNKIKFSSSPNDFSNVNEFSLDILNSPTVQDGFSGGAVNYFHKITIDPSTYGSVGDKIYFRVYVKDDNNPIAEIPSEGAQSYIKDYFSFTIIQ